MKRILYPLLAIIGLWTLSGCKDCGYVRVNQPLPLGKTEGLGEEEKKVDALVKKLSENPACGKYLQSMLHTAVIDVIDFDSLTFTVKITDSVLKYTVGTEAGIKPDLVLPLYKQNIEHLIEIFADGQVSDEESYRIHRAVFGSSLKSLFQVDALYDPKIAKHLGLPNFIEMTLKNDEGYKFMGSAKEATVTVVNVDGQWLIFQGAMGDPDVKWRVSHQQLTDFTKLVYEPGKGAGTSKDAAKKRLAEVKKFIDGITVYRRGKSA